jgi:hypothetical protein
MAEWNQAKNLVEFRRKVRAAEALSAALEHWLKLLPFSGRVSVMVPSARGLNSGSEEGFFRQSHSGSDDRSSQEKRALCGVGLADRSGDR